MLRERPVHADDVRAQEDDGNDGENSLARTHKNLPFFQSFTACYRRVGLEDTNAMLQSN
jgi:hypothetical protein